MSSSGDDGLSSFINGDTSGENPVIDASNPVKWGRLGQTIAVSVLTTIVAGVTDVITSVGDTFSSILSGVAAFISGWEVTVSRALGNGGQPTTETAYREGVIDVLVGGVIDAFASTFAITNDWLGVFALPVNVAIVLAVVYILSVGIRAAFERFAWGG